MTEDFKTRYKKFANKQFKYLFRHVKQNRFLVRSIVGNTVENNITQLLNVSPNRSITNCINIKKVLSSYEYNKKIKYDFCIENAGLQIIWMTYMNQITMVIKVPDELPETNTLARYLSDFANEGIIEVMEGIHEIFLEYCPEHFSVHSISHYEALLQDILHTYCMRNTSNEADYTKYLEEACLEKLWWWACMRLDAEHGHEYGKSVMMENELRPLLDDIHMPKHGVQSTEIGSIYEGIRGSVKYTYKVKNGKIINLMASMPDSFPSERMSTQHLLVALPNCDEFVEISEALSANSITRLISKEMIRINKEKLQNQIVKITESFLNKEAESL